MGEYNKESFKQIMGQGKIKLNIKYDYMHYIFSAQVYVVAKASRLSFYKDQKSSKSNPETTFRAEPFYDLQGSAIEIANDYTKKKHVLRIKYVYLFTNFAM